MNRKEAIERIQEVMTIIRTQHMCKDIDGECTEEDRKAYIQRFEALRMAIEALQEPERKKGQWIILSSNEDSAVCKCSVCGEDFVFYQGEYFPNYCGDCGSDMRKVRKNDRREQAD